MGGVRRERGTGPFFRLMQGLSKKTMDPIPQNKPGLKAQNGFANESRFRMTKHLITHPSQHTTQYSPPTVHRSLS